MILLLVFSTYEFSIHQPWLGDSQENQYYDNVVEAIVINHKLPSIANVDIMIIKSESSNTSSNTDHDIDIIKHNTHSPQQLQTKQIESDPWPISSNECDAIFGNGPKSKIIECSTDKSSFECMQQGTSQQMYCIANNLIIDTKYIQVSEGGEPINDVKGRREDNEFPKYKSDDNTGDSAFNIGCSPQGPLPKLDAVSYYIHTVTSFMTRLGNNDIYKTKYQENYAQHCNNDNNDGKTTVFLLTMRYEYANMYHQSTDWYNFYQIIHSLGLQSNNIEIVFLDGHAMSHIDDAWKYGFNAKYTFIKQLGNDNNKPICINKAVFVSAGYVGGIALRSVYSSCRRQSKYVTQFAPWFLSGFGLKQITHRNGGGDGGKSISIILIQRKAYVAHPRVRGRNRVSRTFGNVERIMDIIKEVVNGKNGYTFDIQIVSWEDHTFREQLDIASKTDIMIGVHGAGLSHVLFLPPKSGLIEILPGGFEGEPHFQHFAIWAGHHYESIRGGSEYNVQVQKSKMTKPLNNIIDKIANP